MAHKYIVDTHALVWFLEGNKRLSQQVKSIMAAPDSEMVLPLIGLAEAVIIIERGRTTISDVSQFLTRVYADPRLEIYPLTFRDI
jgi:PIN domain nuclease of toxin-antitoxin system